MKNIIELASWEIAKDPEESQHAFAITSFKRILMATLSLRMLPLRNMRMSPKITQMYPNVGK